MPVLEKNTKPAMQLVNFGIKMINYSGLTSLELCYEFSLSISNSFFHQNPQNKAK